MAMAGAILKRQNYSFAIRSLNFAFESLSILNTRHSLSTLVEKDDSPSSHLENPFAQFVSAKFNISSVEIARMLKRAPRLQRPEVFDKVEKFFGFLEENGFNQDQIARILKSIPRDMTMSCQEARNKIQLLQEVGIRGEHLVKILTTRPIILTLSLEQRLIPTVTFLLNLYQSQGLFLKSVLKIPSILTYNVENTLKPSVAFWEGCGFCPGELPKIFVLKPSILRFTSFTSAQLDVIQKVGVEKGSKMYKHVLFAVVNSGMETLEAKIRNFQLCGLSYEETMELFRLSPNAFNLAEENIRAKMDFVVENMELPPNSVLKLQCILYNNLDKVTKPRFFVWKEMKSMSGIENHKFYSLITIMKSREADFITKILKGPEGAKLLAIYEKRLADAPSSGSATQISRKRYF